MRSGGKKYWAIRKGEFDKLVNRLGFNGMSFKTWAIEKGIMIVDSGRKDRSVQINGHNVHCVCIVCEEKTRSDNQEGNQSINTATTTNGGN